MPIPHWKVRQRHEVTYRTSAALVIWGRQGKSGRLIEIEGNDPRTYRHFPNIGGEGIKAVPSLRHRFLSMYRRNIPQGISRLDWHLFLASGTQWDLPDPLAGRSPAWTSC